MKSLILKDIFTLTRQLRLFLIMLLIFALIPGLDLAAFAIVYVAFLPMSAIAYDEHVKWDQLAFMMPYSSFTLVLSKYLLGSCFCLVAALVSLVVRVLYTAVTGTPAEPGAYLSIPVGAAAAMLMQAVALPAIFRLGVEKGRLVFLGLIVLVVSLIGFAPENAVPTPANRSLLLAGGILLFLLVNVISVRLSMRFFEQKILR